MSTRREHDSGRLDSGEVDGKRLSEDWGVAHGTIKRWLWEGMPSRRVGARTWIDPKAAKAWYEARFKGRITVAFRPKGFLVVAQREDGAIRLGWSADPMRRVFEFRKNVRGPVQVLLVVPARRSDVERLHASFARARVYGDWYRQTAKARRLLSAIGGCVEKASGRKRRAASRKACSPKPSSKRSAGRSTPPAPST
jgi:hypothetical protein